MSIFEEKNWGWALWCYKDLREMGILTPHADTPWRTFLGSEPIAGFFRRYAELERPFTESVGKLLASTDVEIDTRDQWAREVARDFDVPALDYVLRHLAPGAKQKLPSSAFLK